MIIYRQFNGGTDWIKVSESECIDKTEGSGFWKPNTVINILSEDGTVFTPYARYTTSEAVMKND